MKMVRDPQRLETGRLCAFGLIDQLRGTELFT